MLLLEANLLGSISYSWDFGDGTVGSGMITTHQFTNTGAVDSIYRVRLIAQSLYNCNDTIFKDITVRPTPLVGFTATPLQQLFPSSTVNLFNTTNAGEIGHIIGILETLPSLIYSILEVILIKDGETIP